LPVSQIAKERSGLQYRRKRFRRSPLCLNAISKATQTWKEISGKPPRRVSFLATVLAHDLTRHKQVAYLFNDDSFDVVFHLVFSGRQAHDAYQVSDAHVNHFIPESNPIWVKIRVFDSVER